MPGQHDAGLLPYDGPVMQQGLEGNTDSDGAASTWLRVSVWSLLVALSALTLVDVVRGPWDHDSGFFLLRAAFIARGLRPYLDYSTMYPPMLDLIHSIPIALGIDRLALAITIPLAWIAANAAASTAVARAMGCDRVWSVVAAISFLLLSIENGGNHVTLEHGVAFFSLLALLPLLREGVLSSGSLLACGAALSCAVLSKQNGIVAAMPVAAMLLERRRELGMRAGAFLLSGVALPAVIVLGWLRFDVVRIHEGVVRLLFTYAAAKRVPVFFFQQEALRSAGTATLLLLVSGTGIAMMAVGRRRLLAAACLSGAVVDFLPRLIRNHPHYMLNAWPFALVLLVLGCRSESAGVARLTRASVAATLLLALLVLPLPQSVERWSRPGLLISEFAPASDALRSISGSETPIRQYGAEPIIEFLADRMPDQLDIPVAAFFGAVDGGYLAPGPLPSSSPVVLVDGGGTWVPLLRDRLDRAGFRSVFDRRARFDLRLTIYRAPASATR